jgi:hypothetical protein
VCSSDLPTGLRGTFTQHDALFFPVYSGTHLNRWTACADCHTDPTTRATYGCMTGTCHPAASTTGLHQGIPGYQYTAAQCLACHPTGLRGTFTQHDALFFPIYSGRHAGSWSDCTACHTDANTRATFSCMTGTCHPATDVTPHHTSVSGYQYVAAACYNCHPQGRTPVSPYRVPVVPRRPPGLTSLPAARTGPLTATVRAYVTRWVSGSPAGR